MISTRAILISVCAHLAVIAALLYFHVRSEYPRPADNLAIEAPLGSIFVKEEASPGAKPQVESSVKPSAAFPGDVKQPGENGSNVNSPAGIPDGDAEPVGKIEPAYPAISRKLGEEGESVFLLGIDGDGSVSSATLEKTSGHERLDSAAREALLHARFQAAVAGGIPVLSMKRFRIEFRIEAQKHEK